MPSAKSELYRDALSRQTRGGLASVAKLTEDLGKLYRLVDELPARMMDFARADPLLAEERAANYLLTVIEPEIRNVTQDHLQEVALILVRDEAFQLMLFERGADGAQLRSWLKELINAGHGSAVEHMSDRGLEYQPVAQIRQGPSIGGLPKIPQAKEES